MPDSGPSDDEESSAAADGAAHGAYQSSGNEDFVDVCVCDVKSSVSRQRAFKQRHAKNKSQGRTQANTQVQVHESEVTSQRARMELPSTHVVRFPSSLYRVAMGPNGPNV